MSSAEQIFSLLGRRTQDWVSQPATTARPPRPTPSLLSLWREPFAIFSTHSTVVLPCALIGFAGVSAVVGLYELLTARKLANTPGLLIASAVIGWLLHTLARGAITFAALQNSAGRSATSLVALRRVMAGRWRTLLASSATHTILTFVCVLGVTPLLRDVGIDTVGQAALYPNPYGIPRIVTARSIDAVVLEPLHPFTELLGPARQALLQPAVRLGEAIPNDLKSLVYLLVVPAGSDASASSLALPDGLIALVSLALLIAAETLLRFRTAAALRLADTACPVSRGLLRPLLESARLSVQHLLPMLGNTVMLRLTVSVICTAGILLPIAIADNLVLPQLAWITRVPWLAPASRVACCLGSAAAGSILAALCAIFDARLFLALRRTKTSG